MKRLALLLGIGAVLGGGTLGADVAINPYTDKGTTLELPIAESLPHSGTEKVIVSKTEPKVNLSKWNGEVNMGISYKGFTTTGDRALLTDRVEWKTPKIEMQAFPSTEGYEIDIVLNEKPATNKFDFTIDGAEDLDFFYQPPLNNGQAIGYKDVVSCTETDCINDKGDVRLHSPENVVGSYAVYHKTKKNHIEGETNYGIGKAYHIYRPKVTDAKGVEIWGELLYKDGILSVTVPQKFLDTAVYPVVVDPTFGNTVTGASNGNDTANQEEGILVNTTPADIGAVSKMTLQGWGSSVSYKALIFQKGAGTTHAIVTNGIGGASALGASVGAVDSTFATPPTLSSAQLYILGIVCSGTCNWKYDDKAGYSDYFEASGSYASPVSMIAPTVLSGLYVMSIYATYATYGTENTPHIIFPQGILRSGVLRN